MKLLLSAAAALTLASTALAQTDGAWTNLTAGDASGTWQTASNWLTNGIASGSGATANFNTLNITADSTVTLNAPVTIGNLIFGDTDATNSAAGWILGNGGNTNNALTLAGTNPTVTVNTLGTNKTVNFNAQVLGTNGLFKGGEGRLVLQNSSNSYTGTINVPGMSAPEFGTPLFSTVVQQGRVILGSATAVGSGNILVVGVGGTNPLTSFLDLNGNTIANNVALSNNTYLYNANISNAATVNGDVWVRNFGRIGSASAADGAGTVIVNGKIVFYANTQTLFTGLGGSLTVLNGTVSHTNSSGVITAQVGTLRANDGVNIATNSTLRIGNGTSFGGIFESGADMTRSIGNGAGLISVGFNNSTSTNIGFSAFGAPITVALGGTSSPTPLTWGETNFLEGSSTLVLNAATANNTLTFVNSLNLGGSNRTISVNAATAIVNGGLTNGALTKAGAGTLVLAGSNSFTAETTITGGTLRTTLESFAGNVTNNGVFYLDQPTNADFANTITGTGAFVKDGAGTLTLSASNSYTGNTTISAGALRLANSNSLGVTTNTVTVAAGATLDLNGQNNTGRVVTIAGSGSGGLGAVVNNGTNTATGLRLAFTSAVTIGGTARFDTAFTGANPNINGGTNTLTKVGTNQFTINAGTVSMGTFNITEGNVVAVNTSNALGDTAFGTVVSSNASLAFFNGSTNAAPLTNNEPITLLAGAELGGNTATSRNVLGGPITLSGGTATVRVEASGTGTLQINDGFTGPGGINKTSGGTLELQGTNTYTGDTTITGGAVTLISGARMTFVIGGNGINNTVNGPGTLNAEGVFAFNLAGASTTTGDSWTIVAPTVTRTYGTNFMVNGFSGSSASGSWTNTTNGATYVFTQSNNVLTVQSGGANPYNTWVAYWQGLYPGFTNTAGTDNPDGDPYNNNEEFAFDGNPAVGSPALLRAVKSGTNAVISWVGRNSGVTYNVYSATNLATGPWTNASVTVTNSANQTGISLTNDYTRREFTVPATNRSFFQVEAVLP